MRTKQSSSSTFAVLLASMAVCASAQADGVKVGGAIEAGYSWEAATTLTTQPGFTLKQSNFEFSGDFGRSSFMIDVPFTSTAATSTAMTFGATLGQAFVAHKMESGFRWKMGQFDALYGFEPNDLARGFFATHGILFGALPVTHVGAAFGYGSGNWGLDLLIANTQMGAGAIATSAPQAAFLNDYGVKFAMTGDKMNWGIGFLYNGLANNTYMLIDGELGFDMGKMRLDFNAIYRSIMVATVSTNTIGILAQPVFNLSETWDLGVRGEFTTASLSTGGTATTTINLSVGPNLNLSKNALMKFNYTLNSRGAATSVLTHGLAIDGVIRI